MRTAMPDSTDVLSSSVITIPMRRALVSLKFVIFFARETIHLNFFKPARDKGESFMDERHWVRSIDLGFRPRSLSGMNLDSGLKFLGKLVMIFMG